MADLSDTCEIWWAGLADVRPGHGSLLSPAELSRREGLRRPADKDRLTLTAALLRLAVSSHVDSPAAAVRVDRHCPRCDRPHGRPTLPDQPDLHVSVSHSGDLVAIALTRAGEVGVDVEQQATVDIGGLSRNVLGPAEYAADLAEFFTYWTRKEAILKATGDGLTIAMPKVQVSRPDEPPRLLEFAGRPELTIELLDLVPPRPGYFGALAVLCAVPVAVRDRDGREVL